MGGLHCEIPWKATVTFKEVPRRPSERSLLESQLRKAYAIPAIYDAVAEKSLGAEVCAMLEKESLNQEDYKRLLEIGEHLYEYE